MEGSKTTRGVAAAVAPVESSVRASTAYLNVNGTYTARIAVTSNQDQTKAQSTENSKTADCGCGPTLASQACVDRFLRTRVCCNAKDFSRWASLAQPACQENSLVETHPNIEPLGSNEEGHAHSHSPSELWLL